MDLKQLEALIKNVPDYPKPGIMFKDITPLLGDSDAFPALIDYMIQPYQTYHPMVNAEKNKQIVFAGIESRGFILAAAMAAYMNAAFVPIRKKGKLPRETYQASYELEYGTDVIEIHKDAFKPGAKVVIVDDVIATGGTLKAAYDLVQQTGCEVIGASTIMLIDALYRDMKQNRINAPIFPLFVY